MRLRLSVLLGIAAISSGCFGSLINHSGQIEKSIRQKAAFDFGCEEDKLQLQKMDAPMGMYNYGVSGCGKKAPYNGGCDNLGNCTTARGGEVQTAR